MVKTNINHPQNHHRWVVIIKHGVVCYCFNMFAPTRTLLHTYNHHHYYHHHRHHHHHHIMVIITSSHHDHHDHHHIMIIFTLKLATPSEQYVDWGDNINFIFMRGQISPPSLNNMLIGVNISTISP